MMKATEFCRFFDFSLRKCDLDEKGKYVAVDDQGVLDSRYMNRVSKLTVLFSALLNNYVFDNLKDYGFEYDLRDPDEVIIQKAYEWIKAADKGAKKCFYEVVEALATRKLENDVR